MKERIEELELDNKLLLLKEEKYKNLEKNLSKYKNRVIVLNKLIKSYKERELKLEKENRVSKIISKEEVSATAPSLKEENIIHSCSSATKISFSSKRIPSLQKDSKYKSHVLHQKLINKKILKKSHILNSNSTINSKKNDSFNKTKNDEGKNTIDDDKYNNSNIFVKKNYSLYSINIKNNLNKKIIRYYSNNKKNEYSTNSYINNSQLYENQNIKLYEKLDIYKKIINRKLSNFSKKDKIKNKNIGFKSCRNNSMLFLSRRNKSNCHCNSLENEYHNLYSIKNKDFSKKVKGITIKVIKGRNKKIPYKHANIKQNIINKKEGIFNNGSSNNSKNKAILINKINGNILAKGDNDNSLSNFFFKKIDNSSKNKIYGNFRHSNKKNKS